VAFCIQSCEILIGERDICGGDILFQMGDLGRAWDRKHHRAAFQNPGQGNLTWVGAVLRCHGVQNRPRFGKIASGKREPRDEPDVLHRAVVEHFLAGAVDEIIAVLDGRDLEEFRRGLDIVDGNLAQSRVADQSLINEGPDRIELLVRRDIGIDPVQLPQIDLLDALFSQIE